MKIAGKKILQVILKSLVLKVLQMTSRVCYMLLWKTPATKAGHEVRRGGVTLLYKEAAEPLPVCRRATAEDKLLHF